MATQTNEYPTKAYGATAPDSGVGPMQITRRGLRHDDVLIEITHCGICHSDLHSARNDWGGTVYPIVPGHEIVGKVTAVGASVTESGASTSIRSRAAATSSAAAARSRRASASRILSWPCIGLIVPESWLPATALEPCRDNPLSSFWMRITSGWRSTWSDSSSPSPGPSNG